MYARFGAMRSRGEIASDVELASSEWLWRPRAKVLVLLRTPSRRQGKDAVAHEEAKSRAADSLRAVQMLFESVRWESHAINQVVRQHFRVADQRERRAGLSSLPS